MCEFKSLQLPCWSRSHRADLRGVRDSATYTGVHVRRGQRCCLAMSNLGVGGYCADWSLPCPCGQGPGGRANISSSVRRRRRITLPRKGMSKKSSSWSTGWAKNRKGGCRRIMACEDSQSSKATRDSGHPKPERERCNGWKRHRSCMKRG